jgi:hypothetical protein
LKKFLTKVGFARFGLYVQDYGGPVGFRILGRHPEWLEWLIIQNTNAYEIGFTTAWDGFAAITGRRAARSRRTPSVHFSSPRL